MLPSRFLSRHVAGAALSCAVLAAPRVTPAQMYTPPSAPVVVSTDWLGKHLNDPNLVLLHVGNRKEYDAGHIPGARYVTLDGISVSSHDHDNGLMLEMPKPDSLRAQLEALGISSNSRVIVYYGNDWVSPATRVVCLTASVSAAEVQELYSAGAVTCVGKDEELERIVEAIHTAAKLAPT